MKQKPPKHSSRFNRLARLAHLLDNAIPIPGTKYRIGLDPILGLSPGGGDTITSIFGAYIVVESARMGIPRKVIGEMLTNIIFDSFAGLVPVFGDLFDVGWKANVKNIALLEQHLQIDPQERKSDLIFILGLILLLGLIIVGFSALAIFIFRWLWSVFQ